MLILAFRDSSFLDGSYIIYTNNYVEIIGVLLATIWAAGTHRDEGESSNSRLGSRQTAGSHGHIHLVKMTSSSTFHISESVDPKV